MEIDLTSLRIGASKPKGAVARGLLEMGVRVVPVDEDEGDVDRYVLSKRLVVERRTGNSFVMGIMDKTLFTSAIYMREHYRLPVLIVEGAVDFERRGFSPQAVRGALSSMMLQYGVSVVASPDRDESVQLIAMMARQEQTGIPDISLIPKRKATTLDDMQRRVVEMLPGCGMVMARDLLQHFGSVERIVSATEDELREVRGLGAKKAKEMLGVLHGEYRSVDAERHMEDAIEAEPDLLFDRPVLPLARQHHIFTEDKTRHIIDMVYYDEADDEIVLVELKLRRLEVPHYKQIRRYLENAGKSKLLRKYLDGGSSIRGVLATLEKSDFQSGHPDVTISVVDREATIEVLKKLRRE